MVGFRQASDRSLLVTLGDEIGLAAHKQVVRVLRAVEAARIPGVENLHPAYCSLLIRFDPLKTRYPVLESAIEQAIRESGAVEVAEPKTVEIPVRYGGEFGPDLAAIAALTGLSVPAVVDLHSSQTYTVYFLGFVPGFAYLGDVPERLAVSRLPVPRKHVPAGSVAIAARQTGVYPISTPGGWRILGNTSLQMFSPDRAPMNLLEIGDRVKFQPI